MNNYLDGDLAMLSARFLIELDKLKLLVRLRITETPLAMTLLQLVVLMVKTLIHF